MNNVELRKLRPRLQGARFQGTLALFWGAWGGVGARRLRGSGWRICLGYLALAYINMDFDLILNYAAEDHKAP